MCIRDSSKVFVGASLFQPNLAQLKANGPWLTLLCFIATAFDHSSRQPPRKLYHNLPLRLAQVNIPQFFEGCGWLAGFKTLWCLSTTRRRNSSITGSTKPAFHPTIHRSNRLIDRSSTPGPATSPCKSFWDYNAVLKVTFQQGRLGSGWIWQNLFTSRLWIVFHQGMKWNGMDSRITLVPDFNKSNYHWLWLCLLGTFYYEHLQYFSLS